MQQPETGRGVWQICFEFNAKYYKDSASTVSSLSQPDFILKNWRCADAVLDEQGKEQIKWRSQFGLS